MPVSAVAVLLGIGWLSLAIVMLLLWACCWRRNAGVVDVAWAGGIGALAILYAALLDGDPRRRIFVAALAGAWSFRLALHLLVDRVVGKPEDSRYVALKQNWGERAGAFLLAFFQVQALLAALLSAPALVAMLHPSAPLRLADGVGVAIWLLAVGGESLADRQLARFRADPANRGRTCRSGLWAWSRHPNYFFEWLHWWCYVVIAFGGPAWWLTLLGPATMLFFLFRITGIPVTEAQTAKTRPDYAEYRRTTSAFFPWPPRRSDR